VDREQEQELLKSLQQAVIDGNTQKVEELAKKAVQEGIDDEAGFSIEQLLIDNEMYSMVARFLQGISVNEETLAADLIQKVGPIPGNYLREAHTKKWWKQEQFLPTLSYRLSYEEWVRDGSKDVAARAREKAKEILNTHQVPPLPEDVDREISKILLAAEKEKCKK